jgi:REP element-mobilizing transposase RayT
VFLGEIMNIGIECYFITFVTYLRRKILIDSNAEIVTNSILFGQDKNWYRLYSFVVMPEHVHIVIGLNDRKTISQVLHSLKSYSAHEINKTMERNGLVWQSGSYIEQLDDIRFVEEKSLYIEKNPIREGLIEIIDDYRFCSAYYRDRMDYEDWR